MQAVTVTGPDAVELADVPAPEGQPGDALVRIERAGVCGTDLKILSGGVPVDYPRILGHELVGTVERPGAAGAFPAGTRVLVNPSLACGRCRLCRADREHLCPNGALMGRDVDGGFAEYVAIEESQLHVVPAHLAAESGAMLQVLGVCVHAQRAVEVFPGQVAAVVGLGVTGLCMVQLLRERGIDRIVGITRSEEKRRLAAELGATVTVPPAGAMDAVAEATGGRGADVVVECVGTVPTLAQAIELVDLGGTIVLFGTITATEGQLPFYQLYHKEITLKNPRAALPRDYDTAIDLVSAGRVRVDDLLSASFRIGDAPEAFAALRSKSGLLKVTLEIA